MDKDKLTTIVGGIIGTLIAILGMYGYKIPQDIATYIIATIIGILGYLWKPKQNSQKKN